MYTPVTLNEKTSYAVSVIRVFATLLIFLCHAVQLFDSALLKMSGQVFNVGVPLFMMISGFLFAVKGKPDSYRSWFGNRLLRILTPYYLFLLFLLLVYVVRFGWPSVIPEKWVFYVLPLQGFTQNYINGAEHLWFVTDILLCYLLTPLLHVLQEKISKRQKGWLPAVFLLYCAVLLLSSYLLPAIVSTTIVTVFSYMLGFLFIRALLSRRCMVFVIMLVASPALRLAANLFLDAMPLYDRFIAPVTHQLLAVSLFCLLFMAVSRWFDSLLRIKKAVRVLDSASYEIYLVHYMFIIGPLAASFFQISVLNFLILVLLTAAAAVVLHVLSGGILKRLKKRP